MDEKGIKKEAQNKWLVCPACGRKLLYVKECYGLVISCPECGSEIRLHLKNEVMDIKVRKMNAFPT